MVEEIFECLEWCKRNDDITNVICSLFVESEIFFVHISNTISSINCNAVISVYLCTMYNKRANEC